MIVSRGQYRTLSYRDYYLKGFPLCLALVVNSGAYLLHDLRRNLMACAPRPGPVVLELEKDSVARD